MYSLFVGIVEIAGDAAALIGADLVLVNEGLQLFSCHASRERHLPINSGMRLSYRMPMSAVFLG
jgi:hypothetical protein